MLDVGFFIVCHLCTLHLLLNTILIFDFIKRIIKKPPILFPLVALFHIVLLGKSLWDYHAEPFPSAIWVQPLWMLAYTVSWLFVCDMKKPAALIYIALTTLNLTLRYMLTSSTALSNFTDTLFPADALFTFFVFFYYRQFD